MLTKKGSGRRIEVAHRSLRHAPSRHHAVRLDDKAEIMAAANLLQNVPRESTASIQDMLFFNSRVAGLIRAAAERIEVVDSDVKTKVLTHSWQAPPPRQQVREITSVKGHRVRVEKRQLEMAL